MFEQEQLAVEAQIQSYCTQQDLPLSVEIQWSPIPFSGEWGIATSFFQLAAQEGRLIKERTGKGINVQERAQEIAADVAGLLQGTSSFSRVEAVRGYLNLYFPTGEFARRLVDGVLQQGADYGRGAPKGERVMVEYAQPNTHHSFHMGHFRNAILGEVLARLVEFAGFETIRATYPGDIGLGVITIVWAYARFFQGQEPQGVHERGQWLLKIYVEATDMLTPKEGDTPEERERRDAYEAERREFYRRWDTGDPEVRELWLRTREWSLQELYDIFEMLDIHMDVWFFESEVDDLAKQIVEELVARGIADDERPQNGPVIVKIDEKLGLQKEKYHTNIVLRSDGTTLYLTKDLALAKVKFERYHVDRSIYVIDNRQSMHMQQTYKILGLMGFPQAEKCFHLAYGFVSLPEGAMSARHGRLILFKDVLDEAIRRVLAVIAEKNPSMPEAQRQVVARQVGLGAMAYAMLSVDNNKDIVFDMDAALNFDGHTAPYVQNAYVRANSILRKAGALPVHADFNYKLTPHEVQLIDMLSRFPSILRQAAQEYKPLLMANYAYELASTFHSLYHVVPVLQSESQQARDARLRLVAAARQTLANALRLLDIQSPEVM